MRVAACKPRRSAALLVVASSLLFVGTSATAQSRVGGQVVDMDGRPVTEVTIRFTPQDAESDAKDVPVRKKGRFAVTLRGGGYRVDLVDADRFVTRAEFEVRREDGLSMGGGTIEGHARDGVTGIPVSQRNEMRLKLFVAPRGAVAAKTDMSLSSPELGKAAKLYNRGEYEQALEQARAVLSADPESGEAWYVIGVALEKLGRDAEAEPALQQATDRIPQFPRIWAALGEVSMDVAAERESAGDEDGAQQAWGRAAEALGKAVERDPETLALQLNLAASLDRTGEHERLRLVLERVLEQDPAHLPSRLRLAGLYSGQGRHDDALALLDEIPATEKRAAVTLYNVAVGLDDEGNADGALLVAKRAAEIDPELSHPKRLIAQLLLGKGDHPVAIEAIRAYLEVAGDDPEAETYRRILTQLEQP